MQVLDRIIAASDDAVRTLAGTPKAGRPLPKPTHAELAPPELTPPERAHSAGLMRVNQVGEVCAQALYSSQALFAQTDRVASAMRHAADEERDHLAWTSTRLKQLNARPSLLNPLWYAGAFALGCVAAKLGDKASLAFVVETERQVEKHLASHLQQLPEHDLDSRSIVEAMRADEAEHGAQAKALGAAKMPGFAQHAMRNMAKLMTSTAYRL